jgi:hypothetical protein
MRLNGFMAGGSVYAAYDLRLFLPLERSVSASRTEYARHGTAGVVRWIRMGWRVCWAQ